jgi:hypothetical protein
MRTREKRWGAVPAHAASPERSFAISGEKRWGAVSAMEHSPGLHMSVRERPPAIIVRRAVSRGSECTAPSIVIRSPASDLGENVQSRLVFRAGKCDDALPAQRNLVRTGLDGEVAHVENSARVAPGLDVCENSAKANDYEDSVKAVADYLDWRKAEDDETDLSEILARTSDLVAVAVAQKRAATCRAAVIEGGGPKTAKKKKKAKSPRKVTRSNSPCKTAVSPVSSPMLSPVDMDDRGKCVGYTSADTKDDSFGLLSREQSKWKLLLDKNRMAGSGQVKCAKKTCEQLAFMSVVEVEAAQARAVPGR